MPHPPKEHSELLRRFRKNYGVTLEELAARVKLSHPTLTMFEKGHRNLSPDAWARVLAELGKIEKEKSAERTAEFTKLQNEWTKAFFPGLGELGGAFRLPAIEARQQQIVEQDSDALRLSKEMASQAGQIVPKMEKKIKKDVLAHIRKNPEKAAREYFALMEWRQKLLDLEAKGYAFFLKSDVEAKDRRIAELEQEVDRWKGHVNEAGSLTLQLTSRVEELEQELARERANKAGDSPG